MGQSFLHHFEEDDGDGDDGCPHDDTYEYELGGKYFDDHRERRVYCRDCETVIERKRLPLEGEG